MKRVGILLVLFSAVLLGPMGLLAEKVATMPAPTAYVDDYAHVLTPDGEAKIEALCREVHDRTKAQIFYVTINTLEGEDVQTFANELFAKWKIGEKKTDRGILILIATGERKRWIEVGYGLEGILNDAKVGDIGREMVPQLKALDYDAAGLTGVSDVAKVIAADANVTLETPVPQAAPVQRQADSGGSGVVGYFPVLFIVLVVLLIIFGRRMGGRGIGGGGYGDGFGGGFGGGGGGFGGDGGGGGSDFGGGDGGSSGGGGAGGDY